MKTSSRFALLCGALVIVLALPAFAAGNSYVSSRPKWNGAVMVVDAKTGSSLEGAFVVSRNIPSGSTSLGLHIVNRDDGRVFDKTDAMGRAKAMVAPLGTLVVWMPGYHPVHYLANLQGDSAMPSPDAQGLVTVRLDSATSDADRKQAAKDAAAWLEPEKRAPFINIGRRANRSVEIRAEARAALEKDGAVAP